MNTFSIVFIGIIYIIIIAFILFVLSTIPENENYEGEEKAQYNFEQYFKHYPRAKAKYNWYTKKEKEYELRETL